jgi:hypothetical protein
MCGILKEPESEFCPVISIQAIIGAPAFAAGSREYEPCPEARGTFKCGRIINKPGSGFHIEQTGIVLVTGPPADKELFNSVLRNCKVVTVMAIMFPLKIHSKIIKSRTPG